MNHKLNIAAIQTYLYWKDPEANLTHFESIITTIPDDTDLVILPEMFLTGFVVDPHRHAVSMDGEEISFLKRICQKRGFDILGSAIVKENEHYYNRLLFIDRQGTLEYYDKRHLFTFGGEHEKFRPGNEPKIFQCRGISFMPLVCYDLRFPVWARNTYNTDGGYAYDILIYVANWPAARSRVWSTLLTARAIENQCYVIGVNRIGTDGEGLDYSGDSVVINARGEVVAAASPNEEHVLFYTIDINELNKFRAKFPVGPDWDAFLLQ